MNLRDYPLVRDWLTVQNGQLCVRSGKVDIGQRLSTALRRIVMQELGLAAQDILILPAQTGLSPDEGITSGSNSMQHSGHIIRLAAATLRQEITGQKPSKGSNQRLTELLCTVPQDLQIDLSTPLARLTDIGPVDMDGLADMVTGAFRYVHDIDLPGLLHARNIRPPHADANLINVDEQAIEKLRENGIQTLIDGRWIVVAGRDEWAVIQAAETLSQTLEWDSPEMPSPDIFAQLKPDRATRLLVVNGQPQTGPIPARIPAPTHTARYERPYQMHGSLAPSAAVAIWQGGHLYITSHSQGIYPLRDSIGETLGMQSSDITITHAPGSGCYGHNGADDAAFEAALIARNIPDTPILLKWSREEEHCWEPYAPAMAVNLSATLLPDGRINAYCADVFSDTHRGRPRPGPDNAGPARLLTNQFRATPIAPYVGTPNMTRHGGMHRNLDPIYDFPSTRLVKNLIPGGPLRTSAMRGLGGITNIFALECFIDEICHDLGRDPIEYRLAQLSDRRARHVLSRLKTLCPTTNSGRGYGYAQYKNAMTRAAVAVDLQVSDAAEITVTRIVIVADAGRIIDRDGVIAQLEGGVIQALSWALKEQVTWDHTALQSRDWDSYPVLRFDDVPDIIVDLLEPENTASVGVGEAAPAPTIAAIANAIHDATGIRMRRLPFTPEAIRMAAAAEP